MELISAGISGGIKGLGKIRGDNSIYGLDSVQNFSLRLSCVSHPVGCVGFPCVICLESPWERWAFNKNKRRLSVAICAESDLWYPHLCCWSYRILYNQFLFTVKRTEESARYCPRSCASRTALSLFLLVRCWIKVIICWRCLVNRTTIFRRIPFCLLGYSQWVDACCKLEAPR